MQAFVASRMGRVSRNDMLFAFITAALVASRMGRVSRNVAHPAQSHADRVASRMGRVSRNHQVRLYVVCKLRRVPHGARE